MAKRNISVFERIRKMDTCCVVCGRSLFQQDSVEYGIGPICRERIGFLELSQPHRKIVGELIQTGLKARFEAVGLVSIVELAAKVAELGYSNVAKKMATTFSDVQIENGENSVSVKSPYSPVFTDEARKLKGRWNPEIKGWSFWLPSSVEASVNRRKALLAALKEAYTGLLAIGSKGAFVL